MTLTCFDVEIADGVAHVRLNRPEANNTLIPEFWPELRSLVSSIDAQSKARVIVISSTGRHFSAGLDLSVISGSGMFRADDVKTETGRKRALLYQGIRSLQETFTVIERARVPVIAAVQGGCVGAALALTTACDLRLVSSDAFFLVAETNLGIVPEVGQLQRLPRVMPDAVVRELVFTGSRLGAERAERVGFVNEVLDDHDDLVARALVLGGEIAAKSPLALWGAKHNLRYAREHSVEDGLDQMAIWTAGMYYPDDCRETLSAQAEERPPSYDDLLPSP